MGLSSYVQEYSDRIILDFRITFQNYKTKEPIDISDISFNTKTKLVEKFIL